MAWDVPTFDTSTRRKIIGQAGQFALSDADIQRYLQMIHAQGQQSLQGAFGAAQANIGSQFTPAFRMAQNRLGGAGALADSGYANRLNRQLQTSAYGDLSRAYGNAAAQQGQTEVSALQNLINQRLGQQNQYIQAAIAGTQKKRKTGDYLAGIAGAGLGAFAGGGFR
jgi:hypothetical protein